MAARDACSCISFIRNVLCCGACCPHHHPPDPAIPAPQLTTDHLAHHLQQLISADTTVDSLNSLIQHLENLSTSITDPYFQEWKKYTENIPGFLESLASKQGVTAIGAGKDMLLPLLGEVLGAIGSLHWAAFGLSMLAWGIEAWDRQHKNSADCLRILKDVIDLLKHTRYLWEENQSIIRSDELMQSTLPAIAEVAFRVSAIFASCSAAHSSFNIKRCVEILGTYIAAASLEESISAVKEDVMKLLVKNGLIKQQQMDKKLDTIEEQTKPRSKLTSQFSKFHTLEDEPLLGRQRLADEVEDILKKDFGKEIVGVCIHGMGGVGKSTIGLHIYNKLLTQFTVCSRVELELDTKKTDLPRFQKQIFQQLMSKGKEIDEINNTRDGREMLLRAFKEVKHMPILLYIDNVDDPNLLPELLPTLDHIPVGSRLLVTTRNENVSAVVKSELNVPSCCSILLKVLDADSSKSLLREKALKMTKNKDILDNNQTLKELEDEVLRLCGGLPLALKVMGSFISTWNHNIDNAGGVENADTWRYVIKAMKEARPVKGSVKEDELYTKLRVSIDTLDDHLRRILWDIVMCQLNNYFTKDLLKPILGAEDLQHLINRHLLEDVESNVFVVNHLQTFDFQFGTEYGNGARVRCHDVIASLVRSMAASTDREHLYLMGDQHGDCPHLLKVKDDKLANIICLMGVELRDVHQLSKMERLRYASIKVSRYNIDLMYRIDLRNLKALIFMKHWSSQNPPPNLLMDCPELRLLYINADNIKLGNFTSCTKLEYIHLYSQKQESINVATLTYPLSLCHLHLHNCKIGNVLMEGICKLTALKELSLSSCTSLKSIPESIWKLSGLEKIHLNDSNALQVLPNVKLKNIPSNLVSLALTCCKKLEVLPKGISKLTTLKELNLRNCGALNCISESIWALPNLEELNLSYCKVLQSLPDVMFENVSSNIISINLLMCEKLEVLPEGISKLKALKKLNLGYCSTLKSIPESIWRLPHLEELNVIECHSLQSLPNVMFENVLSNLISLDLTNCKKLEVLPEGISKLTALKDLNLRKCTTFKSIPESIWRLSGLEKLDLSQCYGLQSLPNVMFQNVSSNLVSVALTSCKNLGVLPKGISKLTTLKELNLRNCIALKSIPESIWRLQGLEELDLSECYSLQSLPDVTFENCSNNLVSLALASCQKLEVLPKGISKLTTLKDLNLRNCVALKNIPESI